MEQVEPWPKPARFFSMTLLVDPDLVGHPPGMGMGPALRQSLILMWGKAVVEPHPQEVCNPQIWKLEIAKDSSNVKWTEVGKGV